MIRVRFYQPTSDPRPVKWPIKHPYWISGETDNGVFILVAYADDVDEIVSNWPEAVGLDILDSNVMKYTFTGRFPKPDWFHPPTDAEPPHAPA